MMNHYNNKFNPEEYYFYLTHMQSIVYAAANKSPINPRLN